MTTLNDHILPSGLTYGQELRRSNIQAKLNGYIPYEFSETFDSLVAEYKEITGKDFADREAELDTAREEKAAAKEEEYRQAYQAKLQLIEDAKAAGFKDCPDIVKSWGWSGLKWAAAYRWVRDAGEDIAYVFPEDGLGYYFDGQRKTVSKARYTGLYPAAYERVTLYMTAKYAKDTHDAWVRNMGDAVESKALYGAKTKNMDWDAYIEGLGPEPPLPGVDVVAVQQAAKQKQEAMQRAKADTLYDKVNTYDGPMTKKGYPRLKDLRIHIGTYISRADRTRLWDKVKSIEN